MKKYFLLAYLKDDDTIIIVLPLFQVSTRLNSLNPYETEFDNEL